MKEEGIGIKVLRGIIIAVLLVLLCALFLLHRQTSRARSEALSERSEELRNEQQSREKIEEETAKLYHEMIADMDLRDVVLWGDEDMVGSDNGSLPGEFSDRLYDKLSAAVTELFPNAVQYEEAAREKAQGDSEEDNSGRENEGEEVTGPVFRYQVHNMGIVNEGMREIFARMGIGEVRTMSRMRIPAGREAAEVEFVDDSYRTLYFAAQTPPKFGTVTIGGVEGRLSGNGSYDDLHPRFEFVRDQEGEAVSVQSGSPVTFASRTQFDACVPVLFFDGDTVSDADQFVENIRLLAYKEQDEEEGYTELPEESAEETGENAESSSTASTAGSSEAAPEEEPVADGTQLIVIATTQPGTELDDALEQAFGRRYIRNEISRDDMTQEDYGALADEVIERLDEQGYFNALTDSLRWAENSLQALSMKR